MTNKKLVVTKKVSETVIYSDLSEGFALYKKPNLDQKL
jgi:hypothetical protein